MDRWTVAVLLIALVNPCAIAVTLGLWLMILGWACTSILDEYPFFASITERLPHRLVPVVSLLGAIGVLVDQWLGIFAGVNILLLPLALFGTDWKTSAALIDWWHAPPRTWFILALEAPLVFAAYFGSNLVLTALKVSKHQHGRITAYVVSVLLILGIVTGIVGFGRPIVTAFVDPDGLRESLDVDAYLSPLLASLFPINLVLAIGLSFVLVRASDDKRVGVVGSATIVVLIAVAIIAAWATGNHLVETIAHMDRW